MKCISISLGEKVYADMIKEALFNYSNLGQYCKTIYLRYLKKTGYFEIIKEYFWNCMDKMEADWLHTINIRICSFIFMILLLMFFLNCAGIYEIR